MIIKPNACGVRDLLVEVGYAQECARMRKDAQSGWVAAASGYLLRPASAAALAAVSSSRTMLSR